MKALIVVVVLAVFAGFAWYLLPSPLQPEAEQPPGGHGSHAGDPTALADGVVLSVDRAAKNLTISNGPLHNLGMPPKTMGFQVAEPALLERIKAGDKVRFHADAIGGAFTATSQGEPQAPQHRPVTRSRGRPMAGTGFRLRNSVACCNVAQPGWRHGVHDVDCRDSNHG
jgi:Cu/Ag efflux protein CusF